MVGEPCRKVMFCSRRVVITCGALNRCCSQMLAPRLINSASSADRPVMIDRHRRDGAIRGGEIQFLRISVNCAEQVIVGDNRPFRLSGGAGGEHHHRRIVAVNRDRRAGQRFGKAERLPFAE